MTSVDMLALWYDDGRPLVFYTGSFRALELQRTEGDLGF